MSNQPMYLIIYRRKSASSMETEIYEKLGESVEELQLLAEQEGVNEDEFIGIWKLGKPMNITLSTIPATVTTKEKGVKSVWGTI